MLYIASQPSHCQIQAALSGLVAHQDKQQADMGIGGDMICQIVICQIMSAEGLPKVCIHQAKAS